MKLKDKKVNIYRETFVPNGSGYTTKVIEPVALNVWAYFRQLSGKEVAITNTTKIHFQNSTPIKTK